MQIVDEIREEVRAGKYRSGQEIKEAMKEAIVSVLEAAEGSTELEITQSPAVILVVGVNG